MRPWFPWYPSDYASDTKFLSDTADLMYRRLLDQYWMNSGPLPMNYRLLGRAINMDQRVIKRYLTTELSDHFSCLCGTCGYTYDELVPLSPPQVCPTCSARNVILFNKRIQAELEISKEKQQRAREAGKLGGLAKAKANAIANAVAMSQPHIDLSSEDNKSMGEKSAKKKKSTRFKPPTIPEIQAYIDEKKLTTVDAETFFHYYESKKWMVGKNKMSNWKSAASGWHSRNIKNNNGANQHEQKPRTAIDRVRAANKEHLSPVSDARSHCKIVGENDDDLWP